MFAPVSAVFNSLSANQAANFSAAEVSTSPILLTERGTTRALAVETVTRTREPFSVSSPVEWAGDQRTRILLFATDLDFQSGDKPSAVSCEADDGTHIYQMTVESVLPVPGFEWITALTVRLS